MKEAAQKSRVRPAGSDPGQHSAAGEQDLGTANENC